MARPKKKIHREKTNLTIDPLIKQAAREYCVATGQDLSPLVERLLREELDRDRARRGPATIHQAGGMPLSAPGATRPPFRRAG